MALLKTQQHYKKYDLNLHLRHSIQMVCSVRWKSHKHTVKTIYLKAIMRPNKRPQFVTTKTVTPTCTLSKSLLQLAPTLEIVGLLALWMRVSRSSSETTQHSPTNSHEPRSKKIFFPNIPRNKHQSTTRTQLNTTWRSRLKVKYDSANRQNECQIRLDNLRL